MKVRLIFGLLAGVTGLSLQNPDGQAVDRGQIVVSISGLENEKGQIGILLFDRQEGFPATRERAVREILLPVERAGVRHTFTDLPFGEYAVSVMHDENKNNKLDTNIFGIPTEGNGVSRNVRNRLGPPKFEQAVFQLDRASRSIDIKMQY